MKYGILEYKNPNCINIGDAMQIIAVMNIYKQMGINKQDVIRVNFYDLQTYDGEEVILPICFPFYGYNSNNRVTCFSPKVIPIFLSLSLFDTNLCDDEIAYLRQYEPIGCRDAYTAEGLAKKGVKTYLNGCMTLTLDAKREDKMRSEIYCIDVPDEFYSYIPNDMRSNIKKGTHIYSSVKTDTDEFAQNLLEEYADRAKLVITSRMHAAIPCYAVGIPVIFVHEEYSYRFSWLEDMLHVYLPTEWDNIDWQGECIIENTNALFVKRSMMEIAKNRLTDCFKINELQNVYAHRNERVYVRGPFELAMHYVQNKWRKDKPIEYAVWGVSQVASALIDYIETNYPLAKLTAVIDAAKTEPFKNCIPKKVDEIEDMKNLFVFITADAVNPFAFDYFEKIEKDNETYLFCWTHIKSGSI